jgi:hypothetical protein
VARTGQTSLNLTRAVLGHYGDVCHLCKKPGANSKDHLIPYSLGGLDTLDNLRPAHSRCNSKRGNRVLNGVGARITVVTGPPASGKTTYVRENAGPDDLIIDLDVLASALMVPGSHSSHGYPDHVRHVAIGARKAAIDRATRMVYRQGTALWIVHAIPSREQLADYELLRYDVLTIDPGREVVEPRARAERPPRMMRSVAAWYSSRGDQPRAAIASAAAPSITLARTADW